MQRLLKFTFGALAVLLLLTICPLAHAAGHTGMTGSSVQSKNATTGEQDFLAQLEAKDNTSPSESTEQPVYITALSFIFKLALVLALAYGTVYGLKKFTSVQNKIGSSGKRIRVVENSPLGANRSLHIVEIGSKQLLVASTPNSVSLLIELDIQHDTPDAGTPAPAPSGPSGFKEQLSMFLGQKPDSTQSAQTVAGMLRESTAFLQDKVRDIARVRGTIRDA